MSKIVDITNQKFGKLTAIKQVKQKDTDHAYWLCICECGNYHITNSYSLRKGRVTSCGCKKKEKHSRNLSTPKNKRLYNIWLLMRHRCYKSYIKCYKSYGAKGITVCDAWRDNFWNFQEWALSNGYRDDLSIDRIDNNKGYCPENCKWSTMHDQQQNKSNCIFFTHNGETHNITEWCKILNIKYSTARNRRYKLLRENKPILFEDIFF